MASRPQRGTGYIGLEQWLGQNQPQAAAMANSLASGIDEQGRRSEALLAGAQGQFNTQADAAGLRYDDSTLYNLQGASANGSLQTARERATAAEKFVSDGYKGPTTIDGFADYKQGQSLARDAQSEADLASDFYGRQALLQEKAGKGGGYSLGQQRLDSALVGAAGGDRIDGARAQWGGLLGKFDSAASGAKDYAARVERNNKHTAIRQRDTANTLQREADAARNAAKDAAKPVLETEKQTDRAERNRERIAERERLKRETTADKMGGGKTNVDRWTDSYLF